MYDSFRLGTDSIYRCDALQQFLWQTHGFGTRAANPSVDITLRQIHSSIVLNATGFGDREREGDALVSNDIHRSIGIRTADCVPILLLDSRNRAIAAVHAGWRGSAAALVTHTIHKMHQDFNTAPSDVYAALGPCIRACCYEVGQDVAAHFAPLFPAWTATSGKRKLDLPTANRRQLEAAGVARNHIFDCGLCTACQPAQFFSYRREPENPARLVTAICRLA